MVLASKKDGTINIETTLINKISKRENAFSNRPWSVIAEEEKSEYQLVTIRTHYKFKTKDRQKTTIQRFKK